MSKQLKPSFPPRWEEKLSEFFKGPVFKQLSDFLEAEWEQGKVIYPEKKNIFRALQSLDLSEVKVVILGQDPYHGPEQAIGLSFAVPNSLTRKPPSLKNIFKEIKSDLAVEIPSHESDLTGWVDQGVLLLNTVLTVEAGKAFSHQNQGWELFTDEVILHLNARSEPIIFILWGSSAQKVKAKIDLKKHVVLESAHPSPLSAYRGFFGSRIFSKTNESLIQLGHQPINWEFISSEKSPLVKSQACVE